MNAKLNPDYLPFAPKENYTRREFVVTALATGFAAAVQPISAETITTDSKGLIAGEIKIPTKDGDMPGYRAMPEGGKNLPVVLVVQEIFGLHEHIKDLCRRLAKAGYMAVSAELYARQGDVSKFADFKDIMPIVAQVSDAQVMADLDALAAWAAKNGGNTDKMAVTGFCWGGRITWMYAAHNPKLKAGAAWYGGVVRPASPLSPTNPIDIAPTLKVPVIGFYGAADASIAIDTLDKMRDALKAAKNPSEINVYPDTPHGFNADYRPSYRKEAAEDAWKKMLAWFKKNGAA